MSKRKDDHRDRWKDRSSKVRLDPSDLDSHPPKSRLRSDAPLITGIIAASAIVLGIAFTSHSRSDCSSDPKPDNSDQNCTTAHSGYSGWHGFSSTSSTTGETTTTSSSVSEPSFHGFGETAGAHGGGGE